jgi:hypothetical protein
MSADRFKKELAQLMDTIVEENKSAGGAGVRFVLLSPIRHEDLRKFKPGLPDPTQHNLLLAQYSKVINELAQERGERFVSLGELASVVAEQAQGEQPHLTENGIHLTEFGYATLANVVSAQLGETPGHAPSPSLRKAIIHKNELFFHRWRPANSTYLFGFRKHEQGQNAKEIPEFDPLIAAADTAIDELKKTEAHPENAPAVASIPATVDLPPVPPLPKPEFTLDDGLQIELWAENPLLFKPTEMNWDPTIPITPGRRPRAPFSQTVCCCLPAWLRRPCQRNPACPSAMGASSASPPSCFISRIPKARARQTPGTSCSPASARRILITFCTR